MNRIVSILFVCLMQASLAVASTYNLRVEVTPDGAGTLNTSSGVYEEGASVYLRTYKNTGFVFKGWFDGDSLLSSATSFYYTMPARDAAVQARYEYDPTVPDNPAMPDTATYYLFTASVSPDGAGTLNISSGKYAQGADVYVRTYANTGFQFVGWEDENGEILSTNTSYHYSMPGKNAHLTAVYNYDPTVPANPDSMGVQRRVSVVCKPVGGGSFNVNNTIGTAGSNVRLYAYTNTGFKFLYWENEVGDTLSSEQNFYYVIPDKDSKVYGVFEYDPAVPGNPNKNYWNKELGEIIVDDFAPGGLSSAVSSAISGSSRNDVAMITVAGRMNDNDFGIANDYDNCTLLDLSRVTGITEVPSYAFDYTNLESVYLPATIEKIGYRAFADCPNLSSLTCYAMTPPVLEDYVFKNVPEGLVVYVPAAAIAQYQDAEGWKNFTILPIQEDIRSISISLPEGTNAADYAQMWLELTNTKSGQRMHYVMTDRQTYTFANIIRNTSWNVTLRNERGDIFGRIDNVEVKDEDVSVVFSTLSKPQNVLLAVKTPEGQDVTTQTQITWTDAHGNYVAHGPSFTGLPVGYRATYSVVLSQELSMQYNIPQMVEYMLKDGDNNIVCQLEAIKQLQISGKVKDAATGLPLGGVTVSASQTFGGKYSKTLNTKTDNNGVFTQTVAKVPTSVSFATADYVSQTLDFSNSEFDELDEFTVPDVSLKSITGATISIGFTYTTVDGELQNWYSDYQNVNYSLFNITKNRAVSQYNVQYPQIVLLEEIEDGDVLRLTATSRTNAFMPVETTTTIAEQKAEATFGIVELGQILSSFVTTGNASVVGSLYDQAGKLVKTYDYTNASLTISNLPDGQYTLVSMGSSRFFNTIYDLTQLPQTGLVEGADYVLNMVEVKGGAISQIRIDEVPVFDERKLYYTGDNTSFTVNKPSIVAGNYLTLTGRIDFKQAYAANVSNVQMVVDIPESCEFVENSVMVGNSTSSYTLNGNRITIPMTHYTDRVRFCVIPTVGGDYAPNAFAQFDIDGKTVTQPIGSANYTAKDLSISVPSTVARISIPVSGTAIGTSNVKIYDNDVLIGQTTSMANGTWAATCELNEPYNLSIHNIHAKITTKLGVELISENVSCQYDKNAIEVSTVTMINTAHGSGSLDLKEYVSIFNFQNPAKSMPAYWYWPNYPDFTFITDFTNNDSTMLMNVEVGVLLSTGKTLWLPAQYDGKTDKWITTHKFNSYELPRNVSISYQFFNRDFADTTIIESHLSNNISDSIHGLCNLNDGILSIKYRDNNSDIYAYGIYGEKPKELFPSLKLKASESGYQTSLLDNCLFCYKDEGSIIAIEQEDSIEFFMMFTPSLEQDFNQWKMWFNVENTQPIIVRRAYEISTPTNILERARDAQIQGWVDMAREKMECADDETEILLWDAVRRLRNSVTYINASFFASVASLTMSGMKENGNNAERAFGYGWNAGNAIGTASNFAPGVDGLNRQAQHAIDVIRNAPSCHPPRNPHPYPGDGPEYVQDPSGYVYEGVSSNRIEGVTATAYYKEELEDIYGDLHESIVKWDAEAYAQKNPLFTDENGMYAWDVPQGLWQVKFEKEGYETTYSEWLPVPPPQLEVNIPMKQNVQPNVKSARAFENAVEVQFDKYMMPEMLTTENIMVLADENVVEGTIELLDEEISYEGKTDKYASKIRFNAKEPFSTTEEVTLIVKNRVKSYAGIRMQDDYQQTFTIEQEIKLIVCDSVVSVGYGNASMLTVSVLPAPASKGKMLTVKTSSPMILGVETEKVTIGNDGKAEIAVSGKLPGTAALTFTVEGTDKTAMTIANVEQNLIKTVVTPKASIASGSNVEKGTAITLTCETEGSTIYYTLDGTCPCENTSSVIRYDGTPIVINETTTIKAIAYAEGMYESEVATFVYTVNNGLGIDEEKTGQYTVYPQLVKDIVNIDIPDDVSANVCIASVHGQTVYERKNMTGHNTVDMTGLTKGMYVVAIRSGNELVSIKIIKIGN